MTKYLVGIDRGHSGVRAGCFDMRGRLASGANVDVPIHRPRPGQSVCRPEELAACILQAVKTAVDGLPGPEARRAIAGVSFSIAGGPLIGYAQDGSIPFGIIFPSDCRRGDFFYASKALERAGISVEEYTAAVTTPVPWMLSNILYLQDRFPDICGKITRWAVSEHALFLRTLGSPHMWETECRGSMHFNYDPIARKYVARICDAVGLHGDDFLPLHYADECCGQVSGEAADATGIPAGTPLFLGTNDMVPHVLAQGAIGEGCAIANYGTFGSTGMRITDAARFRPLPGSRYSLHATGGGFRDDWQISSSVNGCGASYAWLNRNVCAGLDGGRGGSPALYAAMNRAAGSSPIGANGLYYYPDIIGGRAALLGIGTHTAMPDMVRAVLEGMAFEMLGALREVEDSTGAGIKRLFVAGGVTKADVFTQMLADMYQMDIVRADVDPDMAGAKGAAMIAGIGAGLFQDIADAAAHMAGREAVTVHPIPSQMEQYREQLPNWQARLGQLAR